MEVFENWVVTMVAELYTFAKTQGTAHLLWVNFLVCKLYLVKVKQNLTEDHTACKWLRQNSNQGSPFVEPWPLAPQRQ